MIHPAVNRLFNQAKVFVEPVQRWVQGQGYLRRYQKPSPALVWALQEIEKHHRFVRHAVDAGCGRGRNSLYLSSKGTQVTALDFTPGAITALKATALAEKLDGNIRALVYDVTEGWPVQERSIDLVVDAFCFKHITGRDSRLAYKQNIVQALDVRGTFLIAFDSVGDGYYGKYITQHLGDGSALCLDPATNLQSVLFTREHVIEFFAPEFHVLVESDPDHMVSRDRTNQRAPRAILFERNSKSQGGGYARITPETALIKPRFHGLFKADDR
jgi:SAM-dependent methyltransferase